MEEVIFTRSFREGGGTTLKIAINFSYANF